MFKRTLIAGAAMAALFATAAPAQSALSDAQRDEVRDIVRDYILENPDIIEEALILLQMQMIAEEQAEATQRVADSLDELVRDERDFAIGPEDAPIQIVEFFDYNCGVCRSGAGWLQELMDEHGDNVRIVFKESPIFMNSRPGSGFAARAALAAIQQDRYFDFHFALMNHQGAISEPVVRDIASSLDLNLRWLDNAMNEDAISEHVEDNLDLLQRVQGAEDGGVSTPFFVVNGQPVRGLNSPLLDALVADALAEHAASAG